MEKFSKEAPERLKKLDSIIRKAGYFLGVYKDEKAFCHLVVTLNEPEGSAQWAVFMFPWTNINAEEVFLAPPKMQHIRVDVLGISAGLNLSVIGGLNFFKKTREKLAGATKKFTVDMKNPEPFSPLVSYLKKKKYARDQIESLRFTHYDFGMTKISIRKKNPPGPDVAEITVLHYDGWKDYGRYDLRGMSGMIYGEVIEEVFGSNS